MPFISDQHLKAALTRIEAMSPAEQERVCDEIAATQGNLLASVLVQQQLGGSIDDAQILIEILIVMYVAVKESGLSLAPVSEAEQEDHLRRLVESIKFSDGLEDRFLDSSVEQYLRNHPEPNLLAFALQKMAQAGMTRNPAESAKYPLLAGLNLANCLAGALRAP